MKALLICLEEEKEKASRLVSFLEKTGISSKTFLIKTRNEGRKISEDFTHVAVLSPLGPGWIFFLAGFFCGAHLPIIACGEKTIGSVPAGYAFCFKFLNTETELRGYFADEYNASIKNEAVLETTNARQALLDRGIPPTDEALAECVAEGKIDAVSLFLDTGFSPNTKDKHGVPLLCISARNGHLDILELLLRSGAQVNMISDDRGSTAILDSAIGRHKDLVEALIKAGADVDIPSKEGQTALVVVVGAGDDAIVEMLVNAGADPDIEDSLGVSARKYAALFRKNSMIALFNAYASKEAS